MTDLSKKYDSLSELNWNNVYFRPDLQIRAVIILSKESAAPFIKTSSYLEFGDAAYNGGISGVQKERRACKLSFNCNPDIWFNNVSKHCLKSKIALYGNRSACDINREHVYNVFYIRSHKYIKFLN